MFDSNLKGNGMFSTGNINPLNIMVGKNMPVNAMNIAVCCDAVTDDISNPNDKHVIVNKILSLINKNKFPLIGTPNTKTLSNKILTMFTIDNNKYGTAFATTIFIG